MTQVKTRRLHKSLNRTQVFKGTLFGGKQVELTIGRIQAERDRGNCGIFLYWHGRLIEVADTLCSSFECGIMSNYL
jgi:hypothetical protein